MDNLKCVSGEESTFYDVNSKSNQFAEHTLLPCSTENYTLTCFTWKAVVWRVTFLG